MSELNTEPRKVKLENPKQTILNRHSIFLEYYDEELLYPHIELEKWKKKLKTMRSLGNGQFKKSQQPATLSNNDQPLHQVNRTIINRSSSSNSTDENSDNNKTSAEKDRVKTNETNVQKSDQSKLLKVERSNRMNAKETDVIFTPSNATNDSNTLHRLKRHKKIYKLNSDFNR